MLKKILYFLIAVLGIPISVACASEEVPEFPAAAPAPAEIAYAQPAEVVAQTAQSQADFIEAKNIVHHYVVSDTGVEELTSDKTIPEPTERHVMLIYKKDGQVQEIAYYPWLDSMKAEIVQNEDPRYQNLADGEVRMPYSGHLYLANVAYNDRGYLSEIEYIGGDKHLFIYRFGADGGIDSITIQFYSIRIPGEPGGVLYEYTLSLREESPTTRLAADAADDLWDKVDLGIKKIASTSPSESPLKLSVRHKIPSTTFDKWVTSLKKDQGQTAPKNLKSLTQIQSALAQFSRRQKSLVHRNPSNTLKNQSRFEREAAALCSKLVQVMVLNGEQTSVKQTQQSVDILIYLPSSR